MDITQTFKLGPTLTIEQIHFFDHFGYPFHFCSKYEEVDQILTEMAAIEKSFLMKNRKQLWVSQLMGMDESRTIH